MSESKKKWLYEEENKWEGRKPERCWARGFDWQGRRVKIVEWKYPKPGDGRFWLVDEGADLYIDDSNHFPTLLRRIVQLYEYRGPRRFILSAQELRRRIARIERIRRNPLRQLDELGRLLAYVEKKWPANIDWRGRRE